MQSNLENQIKERTAELEKLNTTLEEEITERKKVEKELKNFNKILEKRAEEKTRELEEMMIKMKDTIHTAKEKQGQIAELYNDMEIANIELEQKNREIKEKQKIIQKDKEALEETLKQLKKAHNQLIQNEKMASIGQLAAGVAHELNNPIGFIKSNISSLGEYFEDLIALIKTYDEQIGKLSSVKEENIKTCVGEIEAFKEKIDYNFISGDVQDTILETTDGADRVSKIVADLKEFSHVDRAEDKILFDVNHCLDSTLNIVWNELKYKAKVIKEYGDIPEVACYPHQLNQVFMNLFVNASHAIGNKGEIKIKTFSENGSLFITISDTGKGMPPDVANRIFEPFYTTKPVGKGTGLGLSVSYGIIETHGGEIRVESEEGKGTTFTVRLPVATGDNLGN